MFDSLKHWFDSLEAENKLFNRPDDQVIHVALASILYHIIASDNLESDKEKHQFSNIMQVEFGLSDKQISALYQYVKTLKSNIRSDINTVNIYLKDNPNLRLNLMSKLNRLMCIDDIKSKELEIFHDAMSVFFPEISRSDSSR